MLTLPCQNQSKINNFSFNKVGHIATRYPNKEDKDERRKRKYTGIRDDSDNRINKGNKYCYIGEEETRNDLIVMMKKFSMFL